MRITIQKEYRFGYGLYINGMYETFTFTKFGANLLAKKIKKRAQLGKYKKVEL